MVRESFQEDLENLKDRVSQLGRRVEEALINAVDALRQGDLQKSQALISEDRDINEKRFDIESDLLVLIATQQPMASDLRLLAAMLELTTELERIGDYAKGIAKINLLMGDRRLIEAPPKISEMAAKARDMLHRAIDAFMEQNVDLAKAIPSEDDEVDALYNSVYADLLAYIMDDASKMEQANYLMWAAHNLERTADRVTNICERVIFIVTGKMQEFKPDFGLESIP
ncbi:MAG: phosphate signaling complex protein PhoU [Chloroflexota bacterium]|nr:phosphate signaling complex protein PhoU [Chloroflexota bacterium]